jgi:hypothetical protein
VGCAAAVVLTLGMSGPGLAATQRSSPQAARPLSWALLSRMTPQQVAALQNPLVAVADPIQRAGARMPGLYTSIALDTPDHALDLYVTDVAQAGALLATARRLDPGIDLSVVRVMAARYSMAQLTAAASRVMSAGVAGRLPFRVSSVTVPPTGQGLRIQVPGQVAQAKTRSAGPLAALAGRSVRQLAGVAVSFTQGAAPEPASRENDSAPFIGGDYAFGWNSTSKSRPVCTAGIPVENSSGQDGLIEAGHCFTPNNGVYTQNFGHYIGNTSSILHQEDAEVIWTGKYLGGGSNADEGESDTSGGGINYFPLVATGNPYINEYVCQDGISSYDNAHRVPCNIKVVANTYWESCEADGFCGQVAGFQGNSTNGNWVVQHGDSGAVVFTIHSSSTRNAVGMVSAQCCGANPADTVYFVGQAIILGEFGVHLNPYT